MGTSSSTLEWGCFDDVAVQGSSELLQLTQDSISKPKELSYTWVGIFFWSKVSTLYR